MQQIICFETSQQKKSKLCPNIGYLSVLEVRICQFSGQDIFALLITIYVTRIITVYVQQIICFETSQQKKSKCCPNIGYLSVFEVTICQFSVITDTGCLMATWFRLVIKSSVKWEQLDRSIAFRLIMHPHPLPTKQCIDFHQWTNSLWYSLHWMADGRSVLQPKTQ